MTERAEMEAVIEAVLFVASEPVPRSRLIDLFDEDEREEAAAALAAVLARYGGARPAGVPAEGGNGTAPAAGLETEEPEPAVAETASEAAVEAPSAPTESLAAHDEALSGAVADEAVAEAEPDEAVAEAAAAEPEDPSEVTPSDVTLAELAPEPSAGAEEEAFILDPERRGIMVEEVAGGVRLVTRPELVGWLRRFFDVAGGTKLSMAALETLAIIAYRQPITGPEIQELRSVSPAGVIKTLLERRMVRIAGRKEVVGKPFLYATTREFLIHFGLKSLKDLPPLEDFEETFGGFAEGGGDSLGGGADREEQILAEAAALELKEAAAAESAEAEAIEAIRARYEPAAWPSLPEFPDLAPPEETAEASAEAPGDEDREGEAELSIAGEEEEG